MEEIQVVSRPERFDDFYRREFKMVVGLAYALSGSRNSAEDLAQEAFMAAHREWEKLQTYDNPGAWVRRVVANKAVSGFRRSATEMRALARLAAHRIEPLNAMEPEDAEFWQHVRDLPKRQSQAIALFYLEDRSVEDISRILGCTESTAKVHLHKGRNNLARKLGVEA